MAASDFFYLKPNVVIQPLIDRWYAWSHLIPPATLALNHAERHLPIMDSFVGAPQVHAAAAMDPELAGGPFIQLPEERVEDVRALSNVIRQKRSSLLALGEALQRLSRMLTERAQGYSLESLYAEVPDELQGLVVLAYDLHNRPSFRIIEPLLYASEHYQTDAQSLLLFEIDSDERPFVLSTPSLDQPDRLHLDMPFASGRVDILSKLKWHPMTWADIQDSLELSPSNGARFRQFLTEESPPVGQPYTGPGLRWRYYGHACVLVESGGISIMTDPLIAYRNTNDADRFSFHDLPDRIDCVLITHGHQDHLMLETLLQIRHRIGQIVVPGSSGALQDPSLRFILEQCGFKNVVEVQEFDQLKFGEIGVRAIPFLSEHADLDICAKSTYLVEAADRKLYFGADSRNVESKVYDRVRDFIGGVDTVFLGMECDGAPLPWLYGPLLMAEVTDESWNMGQSRCLSGSDAGMAAAMVRSLCPRQAFVYSMGQEPWLQFLLSIEYQSDSIPIRESDQFVSWCLENGIESGRLRAGKEVLYTV